jgi:hypothetical protein
MLDGIDDAAQIVLLKIAVGAQRAVGFSVGALS